MDRTWRISQHKVETFQKMGRNIRGVVLVVVDVTMGG